MATSSKPYTMYRSWSPVRDEDSLPNANLLESSRVPEVTVAKKKSCPIGFMPFFLIVLLISVMFLLGILLGYYVRESQIFDDSHLSDQDLCSVVGKNKVDSDKLDKVHEDVMYFLTGERIAKFVENNRKKDDEEVTDDRLEKVVVKEFNECQFDRIETETHEISVTYPDKSKPNLVKIFNSTEVWRTFQLTNDKKTESSAVFPYVAFTKKGNAQGKLVYANYGTESDFLVVQDHGISLNNSIVLLRLGHISVRRKILQSVKLGAKGVLLFWDESTDDPSVPVSSSHVPIVSAGPLTEGYTLPTIPVQTVSTDQANWLLKSMTGTVCPKQWQSGLKSSCRFNFMASDNITVQVRTFNQKHDQIITNVIGTIFGHTEQDRYAIVGAPRTAFPSLENDVVASTGMIIELAHRLSDVQKHQNWKPRRSIKIISWGGSEFSHIGLNLYIESHRELLRSRAIAYFDVDELVHGDVTLSATMSPVFQTLLSTVIDKVPDPSNPEETVRDVWLREPSTSVDNQKVSFKNFNTDPSKNAFIHQLGIPTLHLQYVGKNQTNVPVSVMLREEQHHHFKYHAAAGRVMSLVLLNLVDDYLLPFSIDDFCNDLHLLLWTASDYMKDCSKNKINFDETLSEIQNVLKMTKTLQNHIEKYVKVDNVFTIRALNDQRTALDKMFLDVKDGSSYHLLYPVEKDGVLFTVKEICQSDQISHTWTSAKKLKFKLNTILKQMDLSLRLNE